MEKRVRGFSWWLLILAVLSWSATLGAATGARAEGSAYMPVVAGSGQSASQSVESKSADAVAFPPLAAESFRPGSDDEILSTGEPLTIEDSTEGTPESPDTAEAMVAVAIAAPSSAEERSAPGSDEGIESTPPDDARDAEDYDPWESFNVRTFEFNLQLDRYAIKPLATAWKTVVPEPVRDGLGQMFDNLMTPKRLVNNLLQGKFDGAGRELSRFILNSVFGFAGFVDLGKREGLEPSNADSGQTFAKYGAGPGPYLVLPFLPPLTVRDAIGYGVDAALNPLTYLAPFAATASMKVSDAVNERSSNLEAFENVEAGSLDLYGAVRNGYLMRREKAVRE